MLALEEEDPMIFPWDAVSSKFTANDYLRKSRYFLEFGGFLDPKLMHHKRGPGFAIERERNEIKRGMTVFVSRSRQDPKGSKGLIIGFIQKERARIERKEIAPAQLKSCLKPIKLALELNDVALSWKNLMRLIPNGRRIGPDREYTLNEIRALLATASLHLKVAILFMASSGMRVGAFDYLNVGDVKPFEVDGKLACGQVSVYAGEGDDEYQTLVSKEAYLTFLEYLKARRSSGEAVADGSPAIVLRSGIKRCASPTIKNSLNKILWKVGIRTEKKRRHEFQINHGLRKFFDNVAKDYIEEPYVEKLIGHHAGVKEHYDRHIPKPAIEQYLRAMPYLSVDQAYRAEAELSMKLEQQEREHSEDFNEMRLKLLERSQEIQTLKEQVTFATGKLQEVAGFISEIKKERKREITK